jgi:hypothetical protein
LSAAHDEEVNGLYEQLLAEKQQVLQYCDQETTFLTVFIQCCGSGFSLDVDMDPTFNFDADPDLFFDADADPDEIHQSDANCNYWSPIPLRLYLQYSDLLAAIVL